MDPIQILFIVVISILTLLLVVLGIEVFRILRQASKTLDRVNNVLDDVEVITSSVATPVEKLSGFVEGIQHGVGLINTIARFVENRSSKQE